MRRDFRRSLALTGAAALMAVLTACGPQVTVPDVAGVALDDAHNELAAAGFAKFIDEDLFDDRGIFIDANWVVLEQEPAAGNSSDPDSPVTLRVGKIEEDRTTRLLPADSPVLAATEEAAGRAAHAAVEAAERAAAVEAEEAIAHQRLLSTYVNELDPLVRVGNRLFVEADTAAAGVRSATYGASQSLVLASAVEAVDTLKGELDANQPPKGSRRAGTHVALVEAANRLRQGVATLVSAVDGDRSSSLARWEEVRQDARRQWNEALLAMYADSGSQPPLLP